MKHKRDILCFLWRLCFSLTALLYTTVVIKLSTPLINTYSKNILNPIVGFAAPHNTHFGNLQLGWDNLYPMLIVKDLDLSKAKIVPGLKSMQGMYLSIDLFKSVLHKNLYVQSLYVNKMVYETKVANFKDISGAIKDISSSVETEKIAPKGRSIIIPEYVHIANISVIIAKDRFNISDFNIREKDEKKYWQFGLSSNSGKKFKIFSDIVTTEDDDILESVSGNIVFSGFVPQVIIDFAPSSFLRAIKGNAAIKFIYENDYLKANVKHDVAVVFSNGESIQNIIGNSFIKFSNNNIMSRGEVLGAKHGKEKIAGFTYAYETQESNTMIRASKIGLSSSYVLVPFFMDKKNKFYKMLSHPGIKGTVDNLYISWARDTDFISFSLEAELRQFSIPKHSLLPAIDNLNANLSYDGHHGVLEIFPSIKNKHSDFTINDNRLHYFPLKIKPQPVVVSLQKKDKDLFLSAPDIKMAYGDISFYGDAGAVLSTTLYPKFKLHLSTNKTSVVSAKKILPLNFMPKGLNDYLKNSLLGGDFLESNLYLASIDNIDFFDYSYKFTAKTTNVSFKYDDKWPVINNVNANILVENGMARIEAQNSKSQGINFESIYLDVPNLKKDIIDVGLKTKLDSNEGLRYLNNSSLADSFKVFKDDIVLNGNADIDLNIKIDAAKDHLDFSPKGKILLNNNNMTIAKHNLVFTSISGDINLDRNKVDTKDIKATLDNNNLDVSLSVDGENVSVDMFGSFNVKKILSNYVPKQISSRISGIADLDVSLKRGGDKKIILSAKSDAVELKSTLPRPFNISTPSSLDFLIEIENNSPISYKFKLGEDRIVNWTAKNNLMKVTVPYLNYDSWRKIFVGKAKKSNLSIALDSDSFYYGGYALGKTHLVSKSLDTNYDISLISKPISGNIKYYPNKKIDAELKHINFPKNKSSNSFIDVKKIDNLDYNIKVKSFNYGDFLLKNIALNVKYDRGMYRLEGSSFKFKDSDINLKGYWDTKGKNKTYIEGSLNTDNIGLVLSNFPSLSYINGGKGDIKFKYVWDKRPDQITLDNMRGILVFNLKDGSINNLGEDLDKDIGLGVFLNILSLQAIVNEFSFDYAHLDEGRYPFNQLAGGINFDSGLISTDKVLLTGTLGTVLARGDLSVNSNDCDFYVTVLPNVTSSIPTIAAIAGGVVAGFIAWTANKIVEDQVGSIVSQAYRVFGDIKSPSVLKLDPDNLPAQVLLP